MEVVTIQQTVFLLFHPLRFGQSTAQRTMAVFTAVILNPLLMTIRATLHMTTHRFSATAHEGIRGLIMFVRHLMASVILRKVMLKNRLYGGFHANVIYLLCHYHSSIIILLLLPLDANPSLYSGAILSNVSHKARRFLPSP